jgi:NAD(P)-dependent dehydrogenase (short-subunit alcohol dehydrogenase family)
MTDHIDSIDDIFGLQGAHVVITGASGGIGLATVKLFHWLEARVSGQGNSSISALEASACEFVAKADVTQEEEVERFYSGAVSVNGPPDVLVGWVSYLWTLITKWSMEFSRLPSIQLLTCPLNSSDGRLT